MESNFGSPDGDHRRPAEAAVQRRREEGRSLTFFAVLVVLLPLIEIVCLVSVLVDSGLLLMGRSPLQMGSLMRFLCIIGPLCQPTVQMLLYTFYNFLEEQAFNDFEVMFPPDEDGMGDARRLKPWSKRNFLWSLLEGRVPKRLFWMTFLQLPFLLVLQHDLNMGLHYLGYNQMGYQQEIRCILRLMLFANRYYTLVPECVMLSMVTDTYGQIATFVSYPPISTATWVRIALGALVLVLWKVVVRKSRPPFAPESHNMLSLLFNYIRLNCRVIEMDFFNFLVRWMRATGQDRRRITVVEELVNEGEGQVPLQMFFAVDN